MKYRFLIYLILVSFVNPKAQIQKLQEYIEKGHDYKDICKKADKMIRKNKLDDESYREGEYRKEKGTKDFLDDEKLKFERWKWYWRDRLTEDGKFPDLQRQWTLYNQVFRESRISNRNSFDWKHEGPVKNSGGYWGMGRATHVDFHPSLPNVFYVASPNGGLWKTTDNGLTYVSIADNLPYQPVGIVIVDPRAPNTLYITLGEKEGWWQYSMGVYKTTDGGKTWNPTSLNWKLTDNKVIYSLIMNPKNTSILIAATSDGIYKTWNGGNSWTRIRTENCSDVKYMPNDTNVVYAATNDYWGASEVIKSIDGGNTFSKVSDFGLQKAFLKFATTLADPEYLGLNMSVDGAKKFYLSKNAALTFELVSDMPENLVLYFSQKDKSILYCGYVVIYKSIDEGKTWTQITNWWNSGGFPEVHADHHFISHHPVHKDELYFCCDGGLYRYHENTEQWDELVNGLAVTQFYKLDISTTNPPVIIGGSQDNGGWIRRSNNTWGNTNGGDAMSQVIDPSNASIGYTEYWGGNAVYRTTNGFNNLDDITTNIGAELPGQWVTPFSLNPKNPKTFIIGFNDIFVSHDRCNTFYKISNNLTGSKDNDLRDVKISPVDTNLILATRGNLMYISKNFGKNWKQYTLVTGLEITGFEFHPKDTDRIWCTRGGYGAIKVMSSKNRGASWTNITGNFVNTPVSSILYDEASNTLFVGSDFGVFYSDADNINWQYYGNGLPHTTVTDLKIHKALRKLYVSTYGRGFYSIDLPDCVPGAVSLQVSANGTSFVSTDTLKLCLGSSLNFKAEDGLKGNFRWKGPFLDTTLIDQVEFDAGILNNLNRTGNYILEYTAPYGCTRLDTIYIRLFGKPVFKLQTDFPHLDCHHKSLQLKPSLIQDAINYSYDWIDPDGNQKSSFQLSVEKPGIYLFILKNLASNCSFYDSINVIGYPDPDIGLDTLIHNICFGDSLGSIEVSGKKGRVPYTYLWSDQGMGSKRNNLKSGIYSLSLNDAHQCTDIDTFKLTEPTAFDYDLKINPSSGSNGSVDLTLKGSTPPYTFLWTRDLVVLGTDEDLMNLPPGGGIICKITDRNGCEFIIKDIEIPEVVSVSNSGSGSFQLYPNPVKDVLILNFKKNADPGMKLELHDMQGRSIKFEKKMMNQQSLKIDVSQLPPGVYFLKIFNSNKTDQIEFTKL